MAEDVTPDSSSELTSDLEVAAEAEEESAVTEPGKLMRIAVMLREMQEEVRRAAPDDAGRERLRTIYDTSLRELKSVLSGNLASELSTLTLPFDDATPSDSEILIAQAQLIGWLEGLFQGIQAAIFSQQAHARQQLEQLQQRGLPSGPQRADGQRGMGQYL